MNKKNNRKKLDKDKFNNIINMDMFSMKMIMGKVKKYKKYARKGKGIIKI